MTNDEFDKYMLASIKVLKERQPTALPFSIGVDKNDKLTIVTNEALTDDARQGVNQATGTTSVEYAVLPLEGSIDLD